MAITGNGYIKRPEFMMLADVSAGGGSPEWELIGDKIEELAITMNPNVATVTDVTGNTSTTLDKYEPTTSAEPFMAKRDSKLFGVLYDIVREEKTLSDVERLFCCVSVFDKDGDKYAAWTQKGIVAVQSFGGDTTGLSVPFEVHWVGGKTHGSFDPATKTFAGA